MLNLVACSAECWTHGGRGLVGWVFIVSNLHFVSELVQCVCLEINFNVREVQKMLSLSGFVNPRPPLPHNFSGHA